MISLFALMAFHLPAALIWSWTICVHCPSTTPSAWCIASSCCTTQSKFCWSNSFQISMAGTLAPSGGGSSCCWIYQCLKCKSVLVHCCEKLHSALVCPGDILSNLPSCHGENVSAGSTASKIIDMSLQ